LNSARAAAAAAVPAYGRSLEFRVGTNMAVIMQKSRARREHRGMRLERTLV
jgi:hypothetical protein